MKIRQKITIHGIVQGVGFRPFVHKLVRENRLTGWICNSNRGVEMEIEGEERAMQHMIEEMKNHLPPLALIEDMQVEKLPLLGFSGFSIQESNSNHRHPVILIPPDISICDDCLKELTNSSDRRYQYPFINCTNCGPRFSIIQDMPYDRDKTTMKNFSMCPECYAEYTNIENRRYHAQPDACPECGPEITLFQGNQRVIISQPIKDAQRRLKEGQIGAIKGLGGFHLACDAGNILAVSRLRDMKQRDEKPFAVMAENVDIIRKFCYLSSYARRYLVSKERPIVLLKKKKNHLLSPDIAPGNGYIGVMLPYTPLHFLLLQNSDLVVVMTSANFSDEPIIIQNEEAREKFAHRVDFMLMHNRSIYNRCDDSVMKVHSRQSIFIRRSRGYAPFPIVLSAKNCQIMAAGPEEKNTVCFTRDRYAFPSQHLGDLKNPESYKAYQEAIKRFIRIFQFQPEIIACDLHPDYLSTVYAREMSLEKNLPLLEIQHHHAHIASCMAENQLSEKVIGVAFDGTGLGDDGKIWGGEFLVADLNQYVRAGHLKYQAMPGGEQVIHQPWRMAFSYLYSIFGQNIFDSDIPLIKRRDSREIRIIVQMMNQKINTPHTSSCGRLFDAVSSLIGLRDEVHFEGQAAMELESMCQPKYTQHYPYQIEETPAGLNVNLEQMFHGLIHDMAAGEPINKIVTQFHNTITEFTLSMCLKIRKHFHLHTAVLSGGVFQNVFLLERTIRKLKEKNFEVFIHQKMPPNDACISLGQAVIANARTQSSPSVGRRKNHIDYVSSTIG